MKENEKCGANTTSICCHKVRHSIYFCPLKATSQRGKVIKSAWIPKGTKPTHGKIVTLEWVPKGTKAVSTNTYGTEIV